MPKSKDAFRTISEVADWLDTPAHVLRFWESKFTQVKPVKRAGGRRYYRPADMLLLGGIKKLLHDDGLTIKGAQKLLREHGVKHVSALSQPLEEDLIEEAAYEPDAKPAPEPEAPATVLSFPARAAAGTVEDTVSEKIGAQEIESQAEPVEAPPAAATDTPEDTPAYQPTETDLATVDAKTEDDVTAFGGDALPAFLRRTPPAAADAPSKLSIDPTARFEPVETGADEPPDADAAPDSTESKVSEPASSAAIDPAEDQSAAPADSAPTPVFSHSDAPAEVPEVKPEPPQTAPPAIDLPSIAKIAPELDSYDGDPGVLSALPGARRLSVALANEMSEKLAELRALRDRMQG